jgi:hypothetical protein
VLALITFIATSPFAAAGELEVIRTYNVRDIVLTVLNETGEWTTGQNKFVLEFASATRKRLIPVVGPTMNATFPVGGNGDLRSSAHLAPVSAEGLYVGTITLPRAGERTVAVAWSGAVSTGSATFSIPVQTGMKGAR